jgi:hypothetical protein
LIESPRDTALSVAICTGECREFVMETHLLRFRADV